MTGPAEVVGLDQSIGYAEHLAAEAGQHRPDGNEGYLAHLATRRITGDGLTTGRDMQDAFAAAAAAAARHAAELTRQKGVQQAYDQAPDAGDKDFQTGAAGGADQTAGTATTATDPADVKGTPMTENQPAPPAAAGQSKGGFFRCDTCGYVLARPPAQGNVVAVEPAGCPNCHTNDATFTPTEIFYPDRPSDDAIARDTRDVEALIRDAYHRLTGGPGWSVPLADVRAALPADLDRETVDAALYKLAGHSDVYVTPDTDQQQASPETQRAALSMGGQYDHTLRIYPDYSIHDTLQRIRSTSRVQAESTLAGLPDDKVAWLAGQMGVDTSGSPAQLRERVADRADRNHHAWLDDARQGREDGTLLYRADNDPEWVATWTDADRQQVAAAAARLQQRAATEEGWAYVKQRADRWAGAAAPTV